MPKHVFQKIYGHPHGNVTIYIEDYVRSYLRGDITKKENIVSKLLKIKSVISTNKSKKATDILFGRYYIRGSRIEITVSGVANLPSGARRGKTSMEQRVDRLNVGYYPALEPVGFFYPVGSRGNLNYNEIFKMHELIFGDNPGIIITNNKVSTAETGDIENIKSKEGNGVLNGNNDVLNGNNGMEFDIYGYCDDGLICYDGYVIYYDRNPDMEEYLSNRRFSGNFEFVDRPKADACLVLEKNGKKRIINIENLHGIITIIQCIMTFSLVIISIIKVINFRINYTVGFLEAIEYIKAYFRLMRLYPSLPFSEAVEYIKVYFRL